MDRKQPLLVDLCHNQDFEVPHAVYGSKLAQVIIGLMGRFLLYYKLAYVHMDISSCEF